VDRVGGGRRRGSERATGADSRGDAGEADSRQTRKSRNKFLSPLHTF
jgi:hypothetical protein